MGNLKPPVSVVLAQVEDDGEAWKVYHQGTLGGIPFWIPKSEDFTPEVGDRVDFYCELDSYKIRTMVIKGHSIPFS